MSSILEALRKVERERAATAVAADGSIDESTAVGDLIGRRGGRGRSPSRFRPWSLVLGAAGVAALLVAVSIGVSLLVARSAVGPQLANLAPAIQPAGTPAPTLQTGPAVPSSPTSSPAPDLHVVMVDPPEEDPLPGEGAAGPAVALESPAIAPANPDSSASASAPPRSADAEVEAHPPAMAPASRTMPTGEPASSTGGRPQSVFEEFVAVLPEDLDTLPPLTEGERIRLGLPKLKLNIVGPVSPNQPRPWALINMEKVYVDTYITGSKAKLVAVNVHGVALDVGGALYFLEK
jgi:hypothetical protein